VILIAQHHGGPRRDHREHRDALGPAVLHISEREPAVDPDRVHAGFGGLLLLGGRIADYVGRSGSPDRPGRLRRGLALGGAAADEAMLSRPAPCRRVRAILARRRFSLITVTFTDVKDRARASASGAPSPASARPSAW